MITREEVLDALKPIVDPEIHLSIVDLGLIYDVVIEAAGAETEGEDPAVEAPADDAAAKAPEDGAPKGDDDDISLEVRMTLTTPMCPYGPMLVQQVTDVANNLPGVDEARVTLIWEPPWDPRTMCSDEVKDKMGIW